MRINLKTLYKFVTADMAVSKPLIRFGSYLFPTMNIVQWVLFDLFDVHMNTALYLIALLFPTLYCMMANAKMLGNGTISKGHTCPHCDSGVLTGTYCTLTATDRYRFSCGTIGVINGLRGLSDHIGKQCLLNQSVAKTDEDDTI